MSNEEKKEVTATKKVPSIPMSAKTKGKIIRYLVILLLILVITNPSVIPFMPDSISSGITSALSGLFGDVSAVSDMIGVNWIVLFRVGVMIVMLLLLREVLMWGMDAIHAKTSRGTTLINLLRSSLQYILAIGGVFWALSIFGVNLSTLVASAGILALIVGFGAESLISDIVTGLFLIVENQYNVNDVIEVDGYRGVVTRVGIRTTSVTDSSGNEKIFNNSDVRNIIQLSNEDSLAVCDLMIPYEADIDVATKEIEKLMATLPESQPKLFSKVPVVLGVQEMGTYAVTIRIVAYVDEWSRFDAIRAMNKVLKVGMEKVGMGVPHTDKPEGN